MINMEQITTQSIRDAVRAFIVETFLFGEDDPTLADSGSLLESGIVDSTGIMELITYIESTFDIHLNDGEMTADNLDSIERIAQFVGRKQKGHTA